MENNKKSPIKIGDKVRIKNFNVNDIPSHIVSNMYKYFGKMLTVKYINKINNSYMFEEDYLWTWKETDFEEIVFKKLDNKLFEIK